LDNDTWLDLFVVNGHVYPQMDQISSGLGYKQGKLLFVNNGDGTFCDATKQGGAALSELRVSRGAAFGDLDNDGQIDVVVEDLDSSPMILKNEGDKTNRWITLELGAKTGKSFGNRRADKSYDRKNGADRRNPQRRQLSLAKRFARAFRARQSR
jgi:hypothetical protein